MPQDTTGQYWEVNEQVKAIKTNDHQTLEAIYQQNFPKIERFVLANQGDAEQARDLYQDAFLALWRNIQLDRFVPRNETALSGYLYRIARNKWMDQLRSGQFRNTVALPEEPLDGHGAAEWDDQVSETEQEYLVAVRAGFSKLGEQCRDVLSRFYYGKESMSVIAEAFGWTDATARNNKYRCLQKLKELLKK